MVNMLNYVDRMVLAVLVESIRVEIPMTDTQIGILTGLAFAIFYALAGLVIGRLADTISRKNLLLVSISVWSMATAVTGLASNFYHLLMARLVVGTGEAGSTPSSQSLLADYCNYRIRPAAYAIFSTGGTLGLTVGLAGGGWIAGMYGWRIAFLAAGLLGIPVALLVAMTLKEPIRGAQDGASDTMSGLSFGATFKTLLARRSFLMIVLASTCTAFILFGVAQWVPAYLVRAFGLGPAEVGLYFGLATGVGSALGAIIGGFACSKLVERNIYWLLWLPLVVSLCLPPIYWLAFYTSSLNIALCGILAVNLVGALGFGPMTAAMHSVVPAGMRGTATAIYGLATSLLGVGLAPFIIGVMSDILGDGAQDAASLQIALTIAVSVSIGTGLFLYLARGSFMNDQVARDIQP